MTLPALLLALAFSVSTVVSAEAMDSNTETALNLTLQMLVQPEMRNQLIKENPKSRQADDFAKQVAGSDANKQKIYELAAQIMKDLALEKKGDPDQMMKVLEQAARDPEGFAKRFSLQQKQALKDLAAEIERTKPAKAVP